MVYRTSTIKKLYRRTAAEMQAIRDALREIVDADHPQSVRHAFYQLCSHPYELVEKTENGYRTVQGQLKKLRLDGLVPWNYISDGSRFRIRATTYGTPEEGLMDFARAYRKDMWRHEPVYVEVWCESDSMRATIYDETDRYGVSLMSARGFASTTFIHRAAMEIEAIDRPTYLYYIGDWDPSGKLIPEKIVEGIREFAPDAEIYFERLLVTPQQIEEWGLPTKPAKKTSHSKDFTGGTVEAEAIPAKRTREIVRAALEQHIDRRQFAILQIAEESERDDLIRLAKGWTA